MMLIEDQLNFRRPDHKNTEEHSIQVFSDLNVAWFSEDMMTDNESLPLNFDGSYLQYLQLKGDKLTWTSDLESLKHFVEKGLKQQGKWSSPGGNSKQFKSSVNNLTITWYSKKQLTLAFQGRDGPVLRVDVRKNQTSDGNP